MQGNTPLIITIDGPAGAGKSTAARRLARLFDLPYLNSGAIYRGVTLAVLESDGLFDDREHVAAVVRNLSFRSVDGDDCTRFLLADRDVTDRIKDPDVTREVYRIANDSGYRKLLVGLQRASVGARGLVAEGRDMGTVIFPEATVKFFLDAPVEERARRQNLELQARGVDSQYRRLLAALKERDDRDTNRSRAPLRAAEDAVHIDSGGLSVDEVVHEMATVIRRRVKVGTNFSPSRVAEEKNK